MKVKVYCNKRSGSINTRSTLYLINKRIMSKDVLKWGEIYDGDLDSSSTFELSNG